uniref:ABC-2 type transporter transmembrane domain-containing protein n=2 Tax=Culex quinquefasciatus TaxID=7176 RepID=A0A1S4KHN5_CULQU
MAVFVREYKSNCYSIAAYFCSKIVADFPLMLAGVTCFQLIAYYLTGQLNETSRIVMFWAVCALMGWTAQMYGMVAGSVFPVDVSPFVVPSSMIPMILFSGFFIRYSELLDVFKPLTYVSPFRYGFEGLALTTYGMNRTEIGCEDMFCYYRKSVKVLELLEVKDSCYWMDVGGLGVWILVLHILLYDDPLTGHLFTIEGQRWKNLRAKLTPTFTSGKMKLMFPIVADVAVELKKCLVTEKDDGGEVELKDVLARYTTDVIGKCAFGLDCNSLENPNAEFREMGRKIFTTTPFSIIKLFFVQQIKPLARKLGVTVLNQEVTKYFLKAVKDTVEYRESNNVERNDFMNLLIKLKNAEPVDEGSSRSMEKLSVNGVSAQA